MTECSCEIYCNKLFGPEFYRAGMVKARKYHKCSEFNCDILPGDEYEYVVGKWDGEFMNFKICESCLSARAEFFPGSYPLGDLWNYIYEYICDCNGEISEDCISRLHERARAKVCEYIEDVWIDE